MWLEHLPWGLKQVRTTIPAQLLESAKGKWMMQSATKRVKKSFPLELLPGVFNPLGPFSLSLAHFQDKVLHNHSGWLAGGF